MSLTWFVGRRYLMARRRQAFISLITVISTLGVAVGVMALVIALAISTGFTTRIQEKIQLLNAHLNILGGPGQLDSRGAGEDPRGSRGGPAGEGLHADRARDRTPERAHDAVGQWWPRCWA